jgi:benzoylformate decarboxylase
VGEGEIVRAARILLETLSRLGVDRIFGLPGTTEAPLLDALVDFPAVRYHLGLHESAVLGMADGYARATGKPAVVNLHTTVGTGNGLTGLFNAWKDGSPLLVIATHKHSGILGRDGFCVGPNLAEWARPITKWAWQGISAAQVGDEVVRAYKTAAAPPSGPVFLCYPEDLLAADIDIGDFRLPSGPPRVEAPFLPSGAAVAEAAALVAAARQPLVIAGDEVWRTDAVSAVVDLVERWKLPVFHEAGRSAVFWNFPTRHPLYAGVYDVKHPYVASADVILALGCRLSVEFQPAAEPDVPAGSRLIHVHRSAWELSKLYPATLAVQASVAAFVQELCRWLETHPGAWKPFYGVADSASAFRRTEGQDGSITAEELVAALAQTAPVDTVVVEETIRSLPTLLSRYPLEAGGYFHTSGGGLGWGVAAAVGVKMAWAERPVLAVVGDGSLLFGVQALWNAAREPAPVKVVVLNNQKYLAVEAGLRAYGGDAVERGRFPGVALTPPAVNFVELASGFGVAGRRVESREDLMPALHWMWDAAGPALVDVRVADDPGM